MLQFVDSFVVQRLQDYFVPTSQIMVAPCNLTKRIICNCKNVFVPGMKGFSFLT